MKIKRILTLALLATCLVGCSPNNTTSSVISASSVVSSSEASSLSSSVINKEDVTIVYTNDIHGYVDNATKNKDGTSVPALRLSKIKALVDDMEKDNKNVILADAGDQIQGTVYGSIDNGKSMIDIMDATGYDIATPGNHDFDFGMDAFLDITKHASFEYVSCNFYDLRSNRPVLEPYKIIEKGGVKIAFVGITTPETITSSTPKYFQNDNGEYIYSFTGQYGKGYLYDSVQYAVDEAREDGVDYVVALGHTGVGIDEEKYGIRSIDIINNTTGIDAYIDGHSHTEIEKEMIKNKDGKEIPLTQTGSYLSHVGVMTIGADGTIDTKLESDYSRSDETVEKLEDELIEKVTKSYGEQIGVLDTTLYINNPSNVNQRIIRARETNAGDFVADGIYWYLNNKEYDCDIAIANGGSIRAQLDPGNLTYQSAKSVQPFGNMICMIEATGQQIKDALEMGVEVCDVWDSQWDTPAENGGFLHVAGMTYEVDCSIPSSVQKDTSGFFEKVTGEYRVKNIQVYNKKTNAYEPIDLSRNYRFGGINYILRNSGNGCTMFKEDNAVVDFVGQDDQILAEYIKAFAKGEDNYPHINTANSPLSSYANYKINYENPLGAQRINILNLPEGTVI